MKLISFGRPILDITIKLQPFESYISIGGSETNVAINTALLGEESLLLGAVGSDILWQKLENLAHRVNKLHLSLQKIEERKSGIVVLLIKENDEIYQKFVDYGASEYFTITPLIQKQITEGEIFFTSLFSVNTPVLRIQWEKMIQLAKSSSLTIAMSMGGIGTIKTNEIVSLLKFVKDFANFIFMNREEAEKIDLTKFASQIVVITAGCETTVVKFGDKKWSIDPFTRIQTVHRPYTIGGGDAFAAAFLVSYFRDKDIEKAIRYGHRIAALKLSVSSSHLTSEILKKEMKL